MTSPVPGKGIKTKKTRSSLPLVVAAILVWAGLIYGGFYLAKDYVDNSIQKVQETNAMNVKVLEDRLNSINTEMKEIKSALAQTDETLASTNSTRQELNQKIEELDKQLKALEKSLNILRESGDVEN